MRTRSASASGRASAFALFLGGLALRPQHIIIGPLIPLIQADLLISHSVAGLLATIPVICMGLFAVPAPLAAHRWGTRAAIGACMGAIGLFGVVRAIAPGEALLILATIPVGIGMGLAGALLPVIVRERFASRPASATGMYTNGFQLGAATVSALAVPVAFLLGGWRGALIALSVGNLLIAAAWYRLVPRRPDADRPTGPPPRIAAWPIRRGLVWGLAILFGLRSLVFQGLAAWLPSIYVERGWSESAAGLLVFAMTIVGLPVTIAGMWMADRRGSRRVYLGVASGGLVVALVGLLLLPALGVVWALAVGTSMGILFPMTMTLPLDIAEGPADVGPVSSMMFGIGYLIAAAAPVGLGAVRDVSGSFTASIAVLAGVAIVIMVMTLAFTPERLAARRRAPAP